MSAPQTASCLYEGTIRHRRRNPDNEFRHRIALAYIDLDELPQLLGGRLVRPGPGLMRFRRADYLGDAATPLKDAVQERVQAVCGERPSGPVRLLAQLRSCGICFNPVSFYYCFDARGEQLQQVLAEVTNTPWGERRAYVLSERRSESRVLRGVFDKQLHVSPFFGMDHRYRARAGTPAQTLSVHIENEHHGATVFDATLHLHRRELTRTSVARLVTANPAAGLRTLALIYGHAAALKLKGARTHPHPVTAR